MISVKKIESYVSKNFSRFGINKSREISRLIFEIAKSRAVSLEDLKIPDDEKNFNKIKSYLLEMRYPLTFGKTPKDEFYLPQVTINQKAQANISKFKFYPKNIFIEKSVFNHPLSRNILKIFSESKIQAISSLKEYSSNYSFNLKDYNKRTENLFLVRENYDFFKACPCTSNVLPCNYYLINLGFGCPFECSYCFLQGYQNFPGIIIPTNIESFFEKFKPSDLKPGMFQFPRIGSGEFTDSLVFDHITGFSKKIIEYFSKYSDIYFEFKTKSSNIGNILSSLPSKNIVVSWSLNPQKIIDENEFYTASLEERIESAKKCADAGFSLGFHFDPIFYCEGWEKDYFGVIEKIFSKISPEKVLWISLGTFRMPKELKKAIENRFPNNKILDAELLLGKDLKLRYSQDVRIEIYSKMVKGIRKFSNKSIIYLCMEPKEVWEKSGLTN
ncbi:MAG: hypothetical protein NT145_02130 [Elusimicrobia bacterium]|nr:hypothetical protein [Elusimicrobiota bacterium]